jgi:hypothetical protein
MWEMIREDSTELIQRIDFQDPTPENVESLISLFDFLEENIPPTEATQELSTYIVRQLVKLEEDIRYSESNDNSNRTLCAYMLQGLLYILGYNHSILSEYFDLKTIAEGELNKFYGDEDRKEVQLSLEQIQNYCRFINVAYRYTLTIPELTGIPTLGHYAIRQLIQEQITGLEMKLENPDVYFGKTTEGIKTQLRVQLDLYNSLLSLVTAEDGLIRIPSTAAGSLPEKTTQEADRLIEDTEDFDDEDIEEANDREVFICLEAYALLEQDALAFVQRHVLDRNISILMKFFEYTVDQIRFCDSKQDICELETIFKSALSDLITKSPELASKVIPGIRERIVRAEEGKRQLLKLAETIVDLSKRFTVEI